MKQSLRAFFVFLAGALALVVFVVGLIAPLTPSEGTPTVRDLSLFLFGPILLMASAVYFARSLTGRLVLVAELLLVLVAAYKLIYPMYKNV